MFVAAGVLVTPTAWPRAGPPDGRRPATQWRRFTVTGDDEHVTYGLVLLAVRRAPVGYVAALRESSVLAAAFIGWRYLDEGGPTGARSPPR